MSTICIGGFCFPAYALFPFALIVLQAAWTWFRKTFLGFNDTALFENSRVIHVTSTEQFKELQQKANDTKRSLVVDFTASWCGPCRYIAPIYHELSNRYPCTIFLKVDVDELKSVASGCGVSAMPTFQFFRNGTKCDELRGADKQQLEAKIQKHYVEVALPLDEQPQPQHTGSLTDDATIRQRKPQVVTITTDAQWDTLVQQNAATNTPLFVAFVAPWSEPSTAMAPVFADLSRQFANAVFATIDVDELEDIMNTYNVTTLPTFKVLQSGSVVDEFTGAIASALKSFVAKHATA